MDFALADLNAQPEEQARQKLYACCASTAWLDTVVAGRPYADPPALHAASAAALEALDWAGVREALDAHPRIGERARASGAEAAWSAQEQAGMAGATNDVRASLAAANRAYEDRFGHVFLIFATGKTDEQMLAAARQRLDNDDAAEQATVRAELVKIVDLRLDKLLGSAPSSAPEVSNGASLS
jgi:2-oxo-4-hydroxy-4-carboxy-5-ureidoimidazoline decarboxylase